MVSFHLTLALFAAAWVPDVDSLSYFMLRNKASKCFQLEHVPPETTLRIGYHAPDLVPQNVPESEEDTPDSRRRKFNDMNIVATHRESETAPMDQYSNDKKNRKIRGISRDRMQLEQQTGEMYFRTPDFEGAVEICVQSYVASPTNPSRFAFNLTSSEYVQLAFDKVVTNNAMSDEQKKIIEDAKGILETETSGITLELHKLERMVNTVFKKSQASTKRNAEFEENSLALNKAVRYWPMFRITVLMIGGYLQVSSVLNYMKKKHIY